MNEDKKDVYTPAEKLALVAQDLMDPKEIGLASAEEARLKILPDPQPQRKLGDFVTFEASAVPLDLRAQWAYEELKVVPVDKEAWKKEWKEQHKDEFVIQSRIRSGTALATAQRTVTDLFEGLCLMMEDAAKLLRAEYQEEKNPPIDVESEVITST